MTRVWLAESGERDEIVFRIGRDGDRLLAEWVGLASLTVDREGAAPTFRPEPGADPILVSQGEKFRGCAEVAEKVTGPRRALEPVAVEPGLHADG